MAGLAKGARMEVLPSQRERYALKDCWSVSQDEAASQAASHMTSVAFSAGEKKTVERLRRHSRRVCQVVEPFVKLYSVAAPWMKMAAL